MQTPIERWQVRVDAYFDMLVAECSPALRAYAQAICHDQPRLSETIVADALAMCKRTAGQFEGLPAVRFERHCRSLIAQLWSSPGWPSRQKPWLSMRQLRAETNHSGPWLDARLRFFAKEAEIRPAGNGLNVPYYPLFVLKQLIRLENGELQPPGLSFNELLQQLGCTKAWLQRNLEPYLGRSLLPTVGDWRTRRYPESVRNALLAKHEAEARVEDERRAKQRTARLERRRAHSRIYRQRIQAQKAIQPKPGITANELLHRIGCTSPRWLYVEILEFADQRLPGAGRPRYPESLEGELRRRWELHQKQRMENRATDWRIRPLQPAESIVNMLDCSWGWANRRLATRRHRATRGPAGNGHETWLYPEDVYRELEAERQASRK